MQRSLNCRVPFRARGKSEQESPAESEKLARIFAAGYPQNQMSWNFRTFAISDELTALYNRRGFLVLGSERMKLATDEKRTSSSFSPTWII